MVRAIVVGHKNLGIVRAESAKEAVRISYDLDEAYVSVCGQCSSQVEDPDISYMTAENCDDPADMATNKEDGGVAWKSVLESRRGGGCAGSVNPDDFDMRDPWHIAAWAYSVGCREREVSRIYADFGGFEDAAEFRGSACMAFEVALHITGAEDLHDCRKELERRFGLDIDLCDLHGDALDRLDRAIQDERCSRQSA